MEITCKEQIKEVTFFSFKYNSLFGVSQDSSDLSDAHSVLRFAEHVLM